MGLKCLYMIYTSSLMSYVFSPSFVCFTKLSKGSHLSLMKCSFVARNENAMRKSSDDRIPIKQSPLEVLESSDVIITMFPSSSHVS
jgi:hypothetical protein